MNERDEGMGEIFSAIGALLRGEPVVAPVAVEPDFSSIDEDLVKKERYSFLKRFTNASLKGIGNRSEPADIASQIKVTFARNLDRQSRLLKAKGEHDLAMVVQTFTLEHLVEHVVHEIDNVEHMLADYSVDSAEYKMVERHIRKLDKLQMAARIAQTL